MRSRREHPDGRALETYLLGLLPPRKAKKVEEHLLTCPECVTAAQEMEEYIRAMRTALEKSRANLAIVGKTKTD
jgi:anti-sigma factor RsiW